MEIYQNRQKALHIFKKNHIDRFILGTSFTSFMIKLEDIENKAYFAMRKAQVKAMETERLGMIHVSDVIKPCMRYVVYNKISPSSGMSTEDMKSLFFGQLVHSKTALGKPEHNEMFLGYNWVRDEPISLEEAQKIPEGDPKHLDIIYGSIDDLIQVGDKWIICDKKTTGSIDYFKKARTGASDTHVDQINKYAVLLKKCYDIEADTGCVIYMSNQVSKETRDVVVPKAFRLHPIEETLTDMVAKAKIIKTALTKKLLPERTKCFLCDSMCPYASKCFTDERDSFEE